MIINFSNWIGMANSEYAIVRKFHYDWSKRPDSYTSISEFAADFNLKHQGQVKVLIDSYSTGSTKWITFDLTEEQLLLSELQYADQPFFQLK